MLTKIQISNYFAYDFWQNFQKDRMVLIVAYIYPKTLPAGLRMFMYDFFFHNFILLPTISK